MKTTSTMRLLVLTCLLPTAAIAQNSFNDPQQQQPMQQQPTQQQQGNPPQGQSGQMAPPTGANGAYGQQPPNGAGNVQPPNFAAASQLEGQDFGVQAPARLHDGPAHGPTPTSIPGGQVVSTQQLATTMMQNMKGIAVLDILGGAETLPGATFATPAAAAGDFNDKVQTDFGNYLQQVTGGNKAMPVVTYCQSPHCWMSYNAALRAINMGYSNVQWYRGGIEAWKAAGLPTASQSGNSN